MLGTDESSTMDISSIVNTQLLLAKVGQASAAANTPNPLLGPASKRLSQQLDSTKVQLSAYGQIKSAFGGVQSSANSLVTRARCTENTAREAAMMVAPTPTQRRAVSQTTGAMPP